MHAKWLRRSSNREERWVFSVYFILLGIRILNGTYLQGHLGTPVLKLHEEKASIAIKEHSRLIDETKEYLKEVEEIKKKILEKLEDFLKSNNLELIPEPIYDVWVRFFHISHFNNSRTMNMIWWMFRIPTGVIGVTLLVFFY